MSGNCVSARGNRGSEVNGEALIEARGWLDDLLDAEWKGRRDREKSVRGRLAKSIGVPARYLFRMQYKLAEMTDVKGSVYRALMRAHAAYVASCEYHEGKAAESRAKREILDAVDQSRAVATVGAHHARAPHPETATLNG